MSKSESSLSLTAGKYEITASVKRTRLPIEKEVRLPDGTVDRQTRFIPMVQVSVILVHQSGDAVFYRQTAMGSRTGITRLNNLPKALVRNLTALGPDMIESGGKPKSTTVADAITEIGRMTGLPAKEAALLLDGAAIEAAALVKAEA